jgi:hypothetical protein
MEDTPYRFTTGTKFSINPKTKGQPTMIQPEPTPDNPLAPLLAQVENLRPPQPLTGTEQAQLNEIRRLQLNVDSQRWQMDKAAADLRRWHAAHSYVDGESQLRKIINDLEDCS